MYIYNALSASFYTGWRTRLLTAGIEACDLLLRYPSHISSSFLTTNDIISWPLMTSMYQRIVNILCIIRNCKLHQSIHPSQLWSITVQNFAFSTVYIEPTSIWERYLYSTLPPISGIISSASHKWLWNLQNIPLRLILNQQHYSIKRTPYHNT